jgi:MFS family permease
MSRLAGNIAVVCTAQFVVVLDATIVTTALPAIGVDLGVHRTELPWVITAYTLVVGALLVPCGRLTDLFGPRRTFRVGVAVFVASSAACAVAWHPAVLVAARAVQGLGAALLSPAALALLTAISEPGAVRRRAVGWWTAAAAGGGASGWVLGGLLTEFLGWRSVFWVNVPIGLVLLVVRTLPPGVRQRVAFDVPGAVAITVTLGLAVYGLHNHDWLPLLLAGVVAVPLVRHLLRTADPVLPVLRSAAGPNLVALALTACTTPAMYLSTLYVQDVMGLSPALASLLFPAFNLAVIAGSLAGPAVLRRLGPGRVMLIGFVALAGSAGVLAALPGGGMPVGQLLVAFAGMGAGLGVASVASTHAGTEAVEPGRQGVAGGVLMSSAQVGTAVGLAVLTPLATTPDVYRVGFLGTGVIAVAGMVVAWRVRAPVPCEGGIR